MCSDCVIKKAKASDLQKVWLLREVRNFPVYKAEDSGPYTTEEILERVESRRTVLTDLVCRIDGEDYKAIDEVDFDAPVVLKNTEKADLVDTGGDVVLHESKCAQHPTVKATQRCKVCGTGICATCDFVFPGDVHLCPRCAAAPKQRMSPKRKEHLGYAYALAVWSTLAIAALLSGVFAKSIHSQAEMQVFGIVISLLIFAPSAVGTGLAVGTLDRRLGNPSSIWAAVIWNGIILGIWILLCIVGSLK